MQKLLTICSLYLGVNGVPVNLGLALVSLTHIFKSTKRVVRELLGVVRILLEIAFLIFAFTLGLSILNK